MRKALVLTFLAFLFSCSPSSSQEIRKPVVAGAFYPSEKEELRRKVENFLNNIEKIDVDGRIIAIITPHAGYDYSGQVAAHSYKALSGRKIGTAVIICNSHTSYFSGIAIDDKDIWQTPLGSVEVDAFLADKLVKGDPSIKYNGSVHKSDHTIEAQLPFLQVVSEEDFKIVPILFGNTKDRSYKSLARLLADNLKENDIVIASADMSHYPNYEDANRIDKKTLEMIESTDIEGLDAHIEEIESKNIPNEQTLCCGIDGVKTVLELCNILGNAEIKTLHYANSGDAIIGDKSRVVGYGSVIIYVPNDSEKKEEVKVEEYLNKEEKKKLIEIARLSILEAVTGKRQFFPKVDEPRLKENCGAFVTIKKHGDLRGCIGYIIAVKPLYETVKDIAHSAAINDYRFSPVSEKELQDLEIEISALTPLKRIKDIREIEVGKHGLYMKRGFESGLLLPQVATEYNWDKETFLQHTCLKAGLPANAWQDKSTEIYIFSAEVFSENDLK